MFINHVRAGIANSDLLPETAPLSVAMHDSLVILSAAHPEGGMVQVSLTLDDIRHIIASVASIATGPVGVRQSDDELEKLKTDISNLARRIEDLER